MTQACDTPMVGTFPKDSRRIGVDIRVEDAVWTSEEWFQLATGAAELGLWYWDEVNQQLRWDAKTHELFGAPAEGEITLQTFLAALHAEDRDRVVRTWRDALENKLPYASDMRVVIDSEDGSKTRWIHGRGSGYYDERGKPLFMVGVAFDITERKEAYQRLRESEERFRLLADAAPVLIWMSGTDKSCNYFNQPWLEFTGQPLEAQLGDSWSAGVHPEDLRFCLNTYSSAFDRREPFKMQYRLRRNDGIYRWIFDIGVPRLNSDGSFAGYVGSCIDITDHKMAEDALVSLSGRLIRAQEEERQRIARELHDDYAQRLAMVAIELDTLSEKMGASSAEVRQQFSELFDQISEIGADLHSLSHRLHSSTLERLGLVAGLQSLCNEFSQQNDIQVEFAHENVPSGIPADTALCVFRVTQEALRNIKKHSGASRADVRLECSDDGLCLSVLDQGCGFDSHASPSGIGIQSMKERLRLMGGRLEIHSGLARGVRIEAWLPLNIPITQATVPQSV